MVLVLAFFCCTAKQTTQPSRKKTQNAKTFEVKEHIFFSSAAVPAFLYYFISYAIKMSNMHANFEDRYFQTLLLYCETDNTNIESVCLATRAAKFLSWNIWN